MTKYSEIFELFLAGIEDNYIDNIFRNLPSDAEVYMTPFLIRGLVNFTKCKKNLEDRDDTQRTFNIDLTTSEKVILSNLMIVEWLRKEVNDILQMKLHIQSDFKSYSEANQLDKKRSYLNDTIELVDKQMLAYDYANINWQTLGQ